jgi:MFS family permease
MPVYVVALIVMAIGIFLHAFARTWPVLIGFRLIFALGAAGAASMITALLGDYPKNGAPRNRTGGGVVRSEAATLLRINAIFAILVLTKPFHTLCRE